MLRKGFVLVLITSLLNLLSISCSDRGIMTPPRKTSEDVTLGEVHNQFVKGFMKRCPQRCALSRYNYIRAYVESIREVCEEQNYDFMPTKELMDEYLEMFEKWREAGIWDVYNPLKYSPYDAIDGFVKAGYIPEDNADYLHKLLDDLCQSCGELQSDGGREMVRLSPAPSGELDAARELLQSSCVLWLSEYDPGTPVKIIDPDATFWKKVGYYAAIGYADGLAGWGAGALTGGNPFAVACAAGLCSTFVKDTLDENTDWGSGGS